MCEDLGSDPQYTLKEGHSVYHLSARELDIGKSLELAGLPA